MRRYFFSHAAQYARAITPYVASYRVFIFEVF